LTSATGSSRSTVLARLRRATVAAVAFGAALLVATPARADCSLLDLDCVTETVSEAADETTEVVDDVLEAAEPAVTTVVEVVESVVTTVEETVDDVVTVVEETVEGTVGGIDPEEPRPGTDGEDSGARPEGDPAPATTVPSAAGPDTATPHASAGAATVAGGGTRPLVDAFAPGRTPLAAAASTATAATEIDAPSAGGVEASPPVVREAGPSALAEAARTLAFPLALAVMIVLFLVAQHRIDRRTPKLAFAPVEPDVVGFRRAAGR
jgi:hypothetical protein